MASFSEIGSEANITLFLMPDYPTIHTEYLKCFLLYLQSAYNISLQLPYSCFQSWVVQVVQSPIPANHAQHSVSLKPPRTSFHELVWKSISSLFKEYEVIQKTTSTESIFTLYVDSQRISSHTHQLKAQPLIDLYFIGSDKYVHSILIHLYFFLHPDPLSWLKSNVFRSLLNQTQNISCSSELLHFFTFSRCWDQTWIHPGLPLPWQG